LCSLYIISSFKKNQQKHLWSCAQTHCWRNSNAFFISVRRTDTLLLVQTYKVNLLLSKLSSTVLIYYIKRKDAKW
jgi:hypothetical protein